MSLFQVKSVRGRIVLVTTLSFATVVLALTFAAIISARESIRASVDGVLKNRAENFARIVLRDRGSVGGPFQPEPPGDSGPPRGGPQNQSLSGVREDWSAPAHVYVNDENSKNPNSVPYDPQSYYESIKGRSVFSDVDNNGTVYRVYSTPAQKTGQVLDVIQVAAGQKEVEDQLDQLRRTLLYTVAPLGIAVGALATFVVVGQLLRPLRKLNSEATRIGLDGFGERLLVSGQDEFASLANTLNHMIESLEGLFRLEQKSNDLQRQFTGDASHEMKTPISIIKAHLGILKRSQKTVPEESASILAMDKATDRMGTLIQDLLILARSDSGIRAERSICNLGPLLDEVISMVPGASDRTELHIQALPNVIGATDELQRLFSNLIENALRHSQCVEPVEIHLTVVSNFAVVKVVDHGVGIDEEHLPHVFERFYRVDRARTSDTGGTGLGLAICEGIVNGHGGRIRVDSTAGQGTTFTVELPIV